MALVTHGIVSLGSTRTALLFGIALLVGYAFEQVQQLPAVPSKQPALKKVLCTHRLLQTTGWCCIWWNIRRVHL